MGRAAQAAMIDPASCTATVRAMRSIIASVLIAATGAALAQDKPAAKPEDSASGGATAPQPSFRRDPSASQALFARLDKNKDGFLTGSELTSEEALTANWIGVDRDTDGRISRSEFSAITGGESTTARRE
jgi:EF hand